jgi:hypothetical protein
MQAAIQNIMIDAVALPSQFQMTLGLKMDAKVFFVIRAQSTYQFEIIYSKSIDHFIFADFF